MIYNMDVQKQTWGARVVSGAYAFAVGFLFVLVLRATAVQITPPPSLIDKPYPDVSTRELCEAEGGAWIEQGGRQVKNAHGPIAAPVQESVELIPYCQGPLAFERERQQQEEASMQTSLFVFSIGGAAAVVLSVLNRDMRVLPIGLILGGIFAFFVAGVQLWQLVPGIGRMITMIVLFVIVVGAGWYAFGRESRTTS